VQYNKNLVGFSPYGNCLQDLLKSRRGRVGKYSALKVTNHALQKFGQIFVVDIIYQPNC